MKKDITELPSDVQARIKVLGLCPTIRLTQPKPRRFSTGPTLGVVSSTGL